MPDPDNDAKIHVLMMPDYRQDNPYQSLLGEELSRRKVEVVFPSGYRRGLPLLRAWLSARSEILHLHWIEPYLPRQAVLRGFYGLKLIIDQLLLKALGVRIVWTVHNLAPHDTQTPRLDALIFSLMTKVANKLLFHSQSALSMFKSKYAFSLEKAGVSPHGHYADWYPAKTEVSDARLSFGIPLDSRVFLAFGMIRPYKGIVELLKVWSSIESSESILVVAGEVDFDDLDGEIRALLNDSILYLPGRKTDDEVSQLFSAADIAIYNYQQILTSGGVLLALSFDLPVIAPAFPAISETMSGSTLLFPPGDLNAMKAIVTKSMLESLDAERALVREVKSQHGWDRTAEATLGYYREVLSAKS